MSNSPVDTEQDMDDQYDKEQEESDNQAATLVTFRLKVNQMQFFKRMADHFYNEGYIAEPKFAQLAKTCLNIVANRYAQYEEVAMAEFIQKRMQQARGPNVVNYQQTRPPQEQAQKLRRQPADFIPAELRRPSPVDKVKEPEW